MFLLKTSRDHLMVQDSPRLSAEASGELSRKTAAGQIPETHARCLSDVFGCLRMSSDLFSSPKQTNN